MGMLFSIILAIAVGCAGLTGWISIDLLCSCAPVTRATVHGVLGLSGAVGFFLGLVATIAWS